jgi:hypothetical protein
MLPFRHIRLYLYMQALSFRMQRTCNEAALKHLRNPYQIRAISDKKIPPGAAGFSISFEAIVISSVRRRQGLQRPAT